jgi:Domain of unknown function (DUF6429)
MDWAKAKPIVTICDMRWVSQGLNPSYELLYLTPHDGSRAWKGFDWDVRGRLHDKGMIDNAVGKVYMVVSAEAYCGLGEGSIRHSRSICRARYVLRSVIRF